MRLKLCTNGEVLWGLVCGDELRAGSITPRWPLVAGGGDCGSGQRRHRVRPVEAWKLTRNGENTHTEQYGGLMWWGEPTTAERAAIERASDAAACAVRREALLSYADDVRHWTSSVFDLLADGENGADVDLAEVRELLERARSAHASLSEILREVLR